MPPVENRLLGMLPQRSRLRLVAASDELMLEVGVVLFQQGVPVRHVYFPRSGYVSLVTCDQGKPVLEVGMIGSEGMLGAHLALGVGAAPLHAVVQGEGLARRVSAAAFRGELARGAGLRRMVDRYLYVTLAQLATASACSRFHGVSPRLGRWLLMSQDRARSPTFPVTQAFLAYMLGVRRVSITQAAGGLQRRGLIAYRRGLVTVRDRRGLEAAACACYQLDRASYQELLG